MFQLRLVCDKAELAFKQKNGTWSAVFPRINERHQSQLNQSFQLPS